jgi:AhpD family alkylhydroperoxidase
MPTAQARLPYWTLSPEAVKNLRALNEQLTRSGLDPVLIDLVRLRASQINGCVYCIDMHTREAREAGETDERLDALAGWRTSPLFDEREKAALNWAESLTLVAETNAPDADFAQVSAQLSPKEVSDLTFVIAIINAWTRIAIGFRQPVVNPVRATATA